MSPADFRKMFRVLHNIDLADLESAGVIDRRENGTVDHKLWVRFNDDLTTFVLKLSDEKNEKLAALVKSRMEAM